VSGRSPRRSWLLAGICLLLPAFGLAAAPAGDLTRWIESFQNPEPFVSEQAAFEIRKLGTDALLPLSAAIEKSEGPLRFRLERLLDQLLAGFLLELDGEYRALDLDRRELALLEERRGAREELLRLRELAKVWIAKVPDLEEKIERHVELAALARKIEALAAAGRAAGATEAAELERLRREVEEQNRAFPELENIAPAMIRLYALEGMGSRLNELSEVELLRLENLASLVKQREPRVEALLGRLRELGPAAFPMLSGHGETIPLQGAPPPGESRPSVVVLYSGLLDEALAGLRESGLLVPPAERFERARYQLGTLWAREVDAGGPREAETAALLERHLAAVLEDVESAETALRERAATELYRLGERGLAALEAAPEKAAKHELLRSLLRWRIAPETYLRVGIHFGDYEQLSFAARRRKIVQYTRAAGQLAIPTLRAIIRDDRLERSFLVKYAAARTLAAQLGDRQGYLVLQSLHPEMILKRPEISRDLMLLQGLAFIRSKNYELAVAEFSKILEEFPFDFEGNYHLAFAYLLAKDYPRAIHHFEIARRIKTKDELTLYNLACAYSLGGKLEQALEALNAAVEAGFNDAEHMEKDPDLDPLRELPRYQEILRKAAGR
jgi:tetratricopeptide (TPR) repeat protein